MAERLWPTPKHGTIGTFSDLTLYIDALTCAADSEGVTAADVRESFTPRLRSSRHVEQQSLSTFKSLLEEMHAFGWLNRTDFSPDSKYVRTLEGEAALLAAKRADSSFLRLLAARLHAAFVIPGWFVARLWTINPESGEVILPAPEALWSANESARSESTWGAELQQETSAAFRRAHAANMKAFPVRVDDWSALFRKVGFTC